MGPEVGLVLQLGHACAGKKIKKKKKGEFKLHENSPKWRLKKSKRK